MKRRASRYELTPRERRELARRQEEWLAKERVTVAAQRMYFAGVPAGPEKERLKAAMLERAWEFLDTGGEGGAAACDALLEFLPEEDAKKLLDLYFKDDA